MVSPDLASYTSGLNPVNIFVYILKCVNNFHYTGITNNLQKRLSQHLSGKTKFTKRHPPLQLLYYYIAHDRRAAARLERHIKSRGAKRFLLQDSHFKFPSNSLHVPLSLI